MRSEKIFSSQDLGPLNYVWAAMAQKMYQALSVES